MPEEKNPSPFCKDSQNTSHEKSEFLKKSSCVLTIEKEEQGSIFDVDSGLFSQGNNVVKTDTETEKQSPCTSSQGKSVLKMVWETAKEPGNRNRQKKRNDSEGETLCVIPEQKNSSASCEDSQYTEQERSDVLEKSGVLTIEGEGQVSIMDANSSLRCQGNGILEMDTEMTKGPPSQCIVGNKQGEKKDGQKEIPDSKGETSYVILEQKNSSSSCEDSQDTKHEKSEVLEKSACVLAVGGKGQGSIMGANSNFLCQGNSVLEIDTEMAEYPPSQLVKGRKRGTKKNRQKKRHDSEGETLSVIPEQKNPSTSCESSQNTSAPAVCNLVVENGEKSEEKWEKVMAEDTPSQPVKGRRRSKKKNRQKRRHYSEGETLSVIPEQKNSSPSCESNQNASAPAVYNVVAENGEKTEEKLEKVMPEMAKDPPSQPAKGRKWRQDSEGETLSVILEQKNPSPSCESSQNASCPAVYNMVGRESTDETKVVENGEKPEEKLEKVMAEMAEDPPSQPVRSLVASSTSSEVERIASAVNSCLSVTKGSNDIEVSYSLVIRASIGASRRKLLILDVNGLLADVIFKAQVEQRPDIWIARRAIFKRPFCDDFLRFCFENFDVGVWSSRSAKYLYELTDYLLADMSPKLLFCWS
ncbi:FCP1 homology domain [Dillenia turbinata]|uniref:FCP1 homology domain n=1 Tax=Dillenia turbinata TaxID=194707 RepID=A0AAN8UAG7_9MAGN